jgi:hypothetical protein
MSVSRLIIKRSQLQERRTAKDLGGRAQKGSGSSNFAKSDVRAPLDVRAECKTTISKSYSLKLHEWQKIQHEAITGGHESPVMQIEFQGPAGMNTKLAVLDWNEYLHFRRVVRELDQQLEGE